jgi:hypothetical protein
MRIPMILFLVLAIVKQRYRWDRSLSKRLHFLEINLFEQKTLLSVFAANPCGAPHVENNKLKVFDILGRFST